MATNVQLIGNPESIARAEAEVNAAIASRQEQRQAVRDAAALLAPEDIAELNGLDD